MLNNSCNLNEKITEATYFTENSATFLFTKNTDIKLNIDIAKSTLILKTTNQPTYNHQNRLYDHGYASYKRTSEEVD